MFGSTWGRFILHDDFIASPYQSSWSLFPAYVPSNRSPFFRNSVSSVSASSQSPSPITFWSPPPFGHSSFSSSHFSTPPRGPGNAFSDTRGAFGITSSPLSSMAVPGPSSFSGFRGLITTSATSAAPTFGGFSSSSCAGFNATNGQASSNSVCSSAVPAFSQTGTSSDASNALSFSVFVASSSSPISETSNVSALGEVCSSPAFSQPSLAFNSSSPHGNIGWTSNLFQGGTGANDRSTVQRSAGVSSTATQGNAFSRNTSSFPNFSNPVAPKTPSFIPPSAAVSSNDAYNGGRGSSASISSNILSSAVNSNAFSPAKQANNFTCSPISSQQCHNPFSFSVHSTPFAPPSIFSSGAEVSVRTANIPMFNSFSSTSYNPVPHQIQFSKFPASGTRVKSYAATSEERLDGKSSTESAGKVLSISSMPIYKNKSHEELRLEDYCSGDKGGHLRQSANGVDFLKASRQSNPLSKLSSSSHISVNPFSPFIHSTPFPPPTPVSSPFPTPLFSTSLNSCSSSAPSDPTVPKTNFISSSSNTLGQLPFDTLSSANISPHSCWTKNDNGQTDTSQSFTTFFNSCSPLTPPNPVQQTKSFSPFTGASTITVNSLHTSTSCSENASLSLIWTSDTDGQTNPASFTASPLVQTDTATPSTGNPFSADSSGSGTAKGTTSHSIDRQQPIPRSAARSTGTMQPSHLASPFETRPGLQITMVRPGISPPIQYGISSIPVSDRPATVRKSSLLRTRHVSRRWNSSLDQKWKHKSDASKVPFFSSQKATGSLKQNAPPIPRENPRTWVCAIEEARQRAHLNKSSGLEPIFVHLSENGEAAGATFTKQQEMPNQMMSNDITTKVADLHVAVHEIGIDEDASLHKNDDEIGGMPMLRRTDYYTEPPIHELVAKERAEPGYCHKVKDFIVGRYGYGSVKFLGETDVWKLDLDSDVQFNYRELIIYMDENRKPPVGEGLNKPAEVTLLNVKCIDKNTGEQYTHGPELEKYMDTLIKKTLAQGAEFVSFDPVQGEWKVRVHHF